MTTITETTNANGKAKTASDIGKEMLATAKVMREQAAELERIAKILGQNKRGRPYTNSTRA